MCSALTPHTDTASPDDANEISFIKGEIMEILDKSGKWWQAKKSDGRIGSEYLSFLPSN
jgi:SHO1 osmosensor